MFRGSLATKKVGFKTTPAWQRVGNEIEWDFPANNGRATPHCRVVGLDSYGSLRETLWVTDGRNLHIFDCLQREYATTLTNFLPVAFANHGFVQLKHDALYRKDRIARAYCHHLFQKNHRRGVCTWLPEELVVIVQR